MRVIGVVGVGLIGSVDIGEVDIDHEVCGCLVSRMVLDLPLGGHGAGLGSLEGTFTQLHLCSLLLHVLGPVFLPPTIIDIGLPEYPVRVKCDQVSLINEECAVLHEASEISLRYRVELAGDDREHTIVQGVCQREVVPQHLSVGYVDGLLILDGEGSPEGLEGG